MRRMRVLLMVGFATGLAGCPNGDKPGDTDTDPVRNGVQITLTTEADGVRIGELDVRVAEVIFEADGPEGPVSISNATPVSLDAEQGGTVLTLDLPTGDYANVRLNLTLAPGGGLAALDYIGTRDELRWVFSASDSIEVQAQGSGFELGDGPDYSAGFVLHPNEWFNGIDAEELDITEVGEVEQVQVDANRNAQVYDRVLQAIVSSTEGQLPDD